MILAPVAAVRSIKNVVWVYFRLLYNLWLHQNNPYKTIRIRTSRQMYYLVKDGRIFQDLRDTIKLLILAG
jgi:hypothetical protein